MAFNAGCDLLILGGKLLVGEHAGFELTPADIQRVHRHLVTAVKNGRIAEARLNEAVARILTLKERYLNREIAQLVDLCEAVDTAAHRALAQKIATLASERR